MSDTLFRPEILRRLAAKAGVTIDQAEAMLSSLEEMVRETTTGPRVKLKVGTFRGALRSERVARNPKTGERVVVPPKTVISFKPASGTVKIES